MQQVKKVGKLLLLSDCNAPIQQGRKQSRGFFFLFLPPSKARAAESITCKGFRNPLLLPFPGLIVLLGGSLIILRQPTLSGAIQTLGVRVATILGRLVRRVVQRQLLQ